MAVWPLLRNAPYMCNGPGRTAPKGEGARISMGGATAPETNGIALQPGNGVKRKRGTWHYAAASKQPLLACHLRVGVILFRGRGW